MIDHILMALISILVYTNAITMEVQGELAPGLSGIRYRIEGWVESTNILRVRL